MRVIAYTYEADVHCPACTQARHYRGGFKIDWEAHVDLAKNHITIDEHLIPYHAIDREGNEIHPVFDIDEDPDGSFTHCGDCHEELA